MTKLSGLLILTSLSWLLLARPAAAQLPSNGIAFEVSFPFYAGNAKMPAGKYRVTQPNTDEPMLLLENTDGGHSVFLDCVPTSAEAAHSNSDVTFNKYGTTDFINLLWEQGTTSGMQVLPAKAEQLAAKKAAATEHSVPAK